MRGLSRLGRRRLGPERRRGPALTIEAVEAHAASAVATGPEAPVLGASLDRPAAGESEPAFAFAVSGWALGRSSPVAAIEVSQDGVLHARVPVDRPRHDIAAAHPNVAGAAACGFSGLVGTVGLPRGFEVTLAAVLASGELLPLWSVRGRRKAVAPAQKGLLRPVLLRSMGRTGSTWVMRLLQQHPEIVVYRPFEYEPRIVAYWASVLLGLASPRSYLAALRLPPSTRPQWLLGEDGRTDPLPVGDEALHDVVGREAVEELASLARARIDATYRAVARQQGKPGARCFAEKALGTRPDLRPISGLAAELYPDARDIFLVRDPRDMLCSMRAYGRRRGVVGFGRDLVSSDEEHVEWLRERALLQLTEYRARDNSVPLIRYEDLLREPHRVLERVFSYLGLDASRQVVERVLAQASEPHPGMDFHRTAGDEVGDSIGRWRRDLPPEERESTTRVFEEVLDAYDYERT